MKRLLDISISLFVLTVTSPLFIVLVCLIKKEKNGRVFSSVKRVGRSFRPFRAYTFRTAPVERAGQEARLTATSRFLKNTGLSSLPLFFSVLKGDMSLVGPASETTEHIDLYKREFGKILTVRPGLINLTSLSLDEESDLLGRRDDPEEYYKHVILPEKIRMGRAYVRSITVKEDLKIIGGALFGLLYPHSTVNRSLGALDPYRRAIIVSVEVLIFAVSNYLAFFVRFEGVIPPNEFTHFVRFLPLLLIVRFLFLIAFSLHKGVWKYVSSSDILRIITAVSFGSLVFFFCVRYFYGSTGYPRSIYILDWFMNIFLLSGIRLVRRVHDRGGGRELYRKRVLVIGAGDSADMLLRDIEQSTSYPYEVVGLIDDDPAKKGLKIRGVPILGSRKELSEIVVSKEPDEFLLAIPSATESTLEEITHQLRSFSLPIKTVPGLWGILSGKVPVSRLQEISPEDVLFRATTDEESAELKDYFHSRCIMVTGAGGSIGSELTRLLASFGPKRLVLFERHEENLYEIDKELHLIHHAAESFIYPVIGDITDEERVREIMEIHRPEIVFHAAAYKHVPLMEFNPAEAFKTNILGTRRLARLSGEFGVERFLFISTDKSVNPTNIMGMTKKMAERVILNLSGRETTRYMIVRFGNVLGSSGSVVPHFIEQIKRGGPVTVTDPEITRYFMTIPEAVKLVAHAAFMGEGREIFVLDMGSPIKIVDLARRLISLYGYNVGREIDISFIGLRPGEKLHEELYNGYETIVGTRHPRINKAVSELPDDQDIFDAIEVLDKPGALSDSSVRSRLTVLIDKGLCEGDGAKDEAVESAAGDG